MAIPLTIVIVVYFLLFSNPVLLAHTFSENENALFLTMIDKIKAETQLVAGDFSKVRVPIGRSSTSGGYRHPFFIRYPFTTSFSRQEPLVISRLFLD